MKSVYLMDLEFQIRHLKSIINILKKELPDLENMIDRWLEEFPFNEKEEDDSNG